MIEGTRGGRWAGRLRGLPVAQRRCCATISEAGWSGKTAPAARAGRCWAECAGLAASGAARPSRSSAGGAGRAGWGGEAAKRGVGGGRRMHVSMAADGRSGGPGHCRWDRGAADGAEDGELGRKPSFWSALGAGRAGWGGEAAKRGGGRRAHVSMAADGRSGGPGHCEWGRGAADGAEGGEWGRKPSFWSALGHGKCQGSYLITSPITCCYLIVF
jgi:hypothetical protein